MIYVFYYLCIKAGSDFQLEPKLRLEEENNQVDDLTDSERTLIWSIISRLYLFPKLDSSARRTLSSLGPQRKIKKVFSVSLPPLLVSVQQCNGGITISDYPEQCQCCQCASKEQQDPAGH